MEIKPSRRNLLIGVGAATAASALPGSAFPAENASWHCRIGRPRLPQCRRADQSPRGQTDILGRANRFCDRAHRGSGQADQRRRRARFRAGAASGQGFRQRSGPRRNPAIARLADDRQGGVQRRRPADDLGRSKVPGLAAGFRRARGEAAQGRRGRHSRQDQRAANARRLAELQRDLRHHQQSLGLSAHAGRIVRWCCGGTRGRLCGARTRLRHRRIIALPGAFLRRLRA